MHNYQSSNLQKHTSGNPLQRMLVNRFHATIASLVGPLQVATVLDAGCGEGFAMRELFRHSAATIVGIDGSAGAVQIARDLNPQAQRGFSTGDLYALPFADRRFDLVVCMEVLEHLDQPERGLAELARVSREWLLLSVPNEPLFRGANFLRGKNLAAWGNDPGHVNHWSAWHFRRFTRSYCTPVIWRTSFPWTIVLARVA